MSAIGGEMHSSSSTRGHRNSQSGDAREMSVARTASKPNFRWACYEALVTISIVYSLVLAGISCISGVQSSLNSAEGLGTASLAVQTGTMIIQALFFNAILISKMGLKASMLVGIALESVYAIGNLFPTWYTLIPASAIAGFGRPLIRTAEAIYITKLAASYAVHCGSDEQSMKTKFFYIYYVFYCSARVFGHMASSIILSSGMDLFDMLDGVGGNGDASNGTSWDFAKSTKYCGARYCDVRSPKTIEITAPTNTSAEIQSSLVHTRPDATKIYLLCGFSFGCMAVAFVGNALFLKPLDRVLKSGDGDSGLKTDDPEEDVIDHPCDYLLNTIKYWRNPWQLLIMPLTIYNGIDNAFWTADFSKAYVTCYFGIQWVGFVVAWYGLTSPVSVFAVSWLNKPIFRPLTFLVAFAAHISVCVVLLTWTPTATSLPTLFALSAVWGVGSGLWPPIMSAFYGVLFEDNLQAAFSNYWLGDPLGATLTYAWSNALCTNFKIYLFMSVLTVGIAGYFIIELQLLLYNTRHYSLDGHNVAARGGQELSTEQELNKYNEKSSVLPKYHQQTPQ